MDAAAEFVKSWMKLSKDWQSQMEAEMAPQLTGGQLQVLELLKAYEPMKPSELLPHLETTPAAVTTLLDRMERNGLVTRTRDEQDRRIVWISMTELGQTEVLRGLRIRSDIVNQSLDRLSAHNRQLLVYLIGKVAGTRGQGLTSRTAQAAAAEGADASPRSEDEPEPAAAAEEASAS